MRNSNPPPLRIGGFQSRSLYQFTLQSPDLNALYGSAAEFEKRMRTLPGLSDVSSDLQISSPMLNVDIDRDRASSLGPRPQPRSAVRPYSAGPLPIEI